MMKCRVDHVFNVNEDGQLCMSSKADDGSYCEPVALFRAASLKLAVLVIETRLREASHGTAPSWQAVKVHLGLETK